MQEVGKFITKQVVIEAFQFKDGVNWDDLPEWAQNHMIQWEDKTHGGWQAQTLQGPVDIDYNDWIIRGFEDKEAYPCKPEVFERKYELLS